MSTTCCSTSSQAATSPQTLALAQAKLVKDQAAKAAADVIKADQKAIGDAEKSQSNNLVDIKV